VGTNPRGIAMYGQLGDAVVANQGSNTANVIDVIGGTVISTVSTDSDPTGVAIDQGSGTALVTALSANALDTFSVQSASAAASTIGVQQGPIAVGVDPTDDFAAVANGTSNSVTLVNVTAGAAVATIPNIQFPTAVAFDPILGDFLIASSLQNSVQILNPSLQATTSLRVGIDPVSIGYNPATVTLVTGNAVSHTMTVVDFLDQTVRDVFPMAQVNVYGVDVHPLTNLAIVADPANNRVLLVPLPR
jgi:DNA-binding beta-propeller fold protein YncE